MKIVGYIVAALGVVALFTLIVLGLTYPVMWAMNWLFTPATLLAVFGIPQMTFWKTFVFSWLVSWLTKSTSTNTSK